MMRPVNKNACGGQAAAPRNLLEPVLSEGLFESSLGKAARVMTYYECNLGPSWGSQAILGPSWGRLGTVLGPSWAISGRHGAVWGNLGPSWGRLGAILGDRFQAILIRGPKMKLINCPPNTDRTSFRCLLSQVRSLRNGFSPRHWCAST